MLFVAGRYPFPSSGNYNNGTTPALITNTPLRLAIPQVLNLDYQDSTITNRPTHMGLWSQSGATYIKWGVIPSDADASTTVYDGMTISGAPFLSIFAIPSGATFVSLFNGNATPIALVYFGVAR